MLQLSKPKTTGSSLEVNISNSELHWEMSRKKDVVQTPKKKLVVIREYNKEAKCAGKNFQHKKKM